MDANTAEEVVEKVMETLLDGNHPSLEILRKQYAIAELRTDVTKSGIFVDFDLPDSVDTIPGEDDFHFGDVETTMKDLDHGLGFVLFVRDGKLSELEGYTYEEELPERVTDVTVQYLENDSRNLAELLPDWEK